MGSQWRQHTSLALRDCRCAPCRGEWISYLRPLLLRPQWAPEPNRLRGFDRNPLVRPIRRNLLLEPSCKPDAPANRLIIDSRLLAAPSPWVPAIQRRSVQRRMMNLAPLTRAQQAALLDAEGKGFDLPWLENLPDRWPTAFFAVTLRWATGDSANGLYGTLGCD